MSGKVPTLLAQAATPREVALFKRMGAIGCEVRPVAVPDEAVALLAGGAGDALAMPLTAATHEALVKLGRDHRRRVILLAEQMTADGLRALGDLEVGTFLAKSGAFTPEELQGAILKHLKGDLFGIEKYLAWGTKTERLELTESIRRGETLDLLEAFLNKLGLDLRLVGQTLTMTDELITNALYNAPVDDTGRRRHAHLSRIDPVECTPGKGVEVSWACDGTLFAVGVKDRYGTLEPVKVVAQIATALAGPTAPNMGTGGAGIGLITSFNAASQLVFNLIENQASECIGLVEIGSYKKYLEQGKSVHLFSLFNAGKSA